MHGRVNLIVEQLNEILADAEDANKVVAGYGATAKSCTLLNYAAIYNLDWVVDTTPWKQGGTRPHEDPGAVPEG
jgi:hypothetical protein